MPSSVIRRIDYDPDSRTLSIRFVTGKLYLYEGVPPDEVECFRSAWSKGEYFNARIRDSYAYRKL